MSEEPRKQPLYVIAGTDEEFREWCEENNVPPDKIWTDVSQYGPPPGSRNIRIVRYGTWWKNPASRDPRVREREEPL